MRDRYASTHPNARRGVPNYVGPRPPAASPTAAEPGTPAKVAVLAARAAAGESLWHPADPTHKPLRHVERVFRYLGPGPD